jgi:transcription termination factor Rho
MSDTITGVLKCTRSGGVLRDPAKSFRKTEYDPWVPAGLIRKYQLETGNLLCGPYRAGRRNDELQSIDSINGIDPEEFKNRTSYRDLTAIDPEERFDLAVTNNISMRMIDLIAPIGKGTRGLIVSPPKAGKTMILQEIAKSINQSEPDTRVIVLLVDERPEEVTYFRRSVQAEVFASSNDQTAQEHVDLSEITLGYIRTELELGRDVVVLVDSITRMGRAFNVRGSGTGRTMSGGVEAGALEIPRRFFGMARNIEDGGSVTIIATALIDTGSRMDQLIFEEFKGTGNSEVVLNRALAEARIFPAIDLPASGTRKEAKLYGADDARRITNLRREMSKHKPAEAMKMLLHFMEKYPTNEEFLKMISKA